MSRTFFERAKDLTRDSEGTGPIRNGRYMPYTDTVGKITIGIGRNLTDRGLSSKEITLLHENDVYEVFDDLEEHFAWWADLDAVRQLALVDLRYNLGPTRFRKFKTTLGYVERRDWAGAAKAFRKNRRYFKQVGRRAERIAHMLETGTMP